MEIGQRTFSLKGIKAVITRSQSNRKEKKLNKQLAKGQRDSIGNNLVLPANVGSKKDGLLRNIQPSSIQIINTIKPLNTGNRSQVIVLDVIDEPKIFSLGKLPPEVVRVIAMHLDNVTTQCLRNVFRHSKAYYKDRHFVPTLSEKKQLEAIARRDNFRDMVMVERSQSSPSPLRPHLPRPLKSHPHLLHILQQYNNLSRCCSACQDMHQSCFFREAELLKTPEARKCQGSERKLKLCQHKSFTFVEIYDHFRAQSRVAAAAAAADNTHTITCDESSCRTWTSGNVAPTTTTWPTDRPTISFSPDSVILNRVMTHESRHWDGQRASMACLGGSLKLCPHLSSDALMIWPANPTPLLESASPFYGRSDGDDDDDDDDSARPTCRWKGCRLRLLHALAAGDDASTTVVHARYVLFDRRVDLRRCSMAVNSRAWLDMARMVNVTEYSKYMDCPYPY